MKKLVILNDEDYDTIMFPEADMLLEFPSVSKLLECQELQPSLEELVIDLSGVDKRTVDILTGSSPLDPTYPAFPMPRRITFMDGVGPEPSQ